MEDTAIVNKAIFQTNKAVDPLKSCFFLSHNITVFLVKSQETKNKIRPVGQERQRRLDLRLSRKLQQEKKIEDRLKERQLIGWIDMTF